MEKPETNYLDEIISAGQLLRILDSDAKEVSALCQKACLKPKKDGFGNIYFSKGDVDVLRKVKELFERTKKIQEEKKEMEQMGVIPLEEPVIEPVIENKPKKIFLNKRVEKIQEEPVIEPIEEIENLPVKKETFKFEPVNQGAYQSAVIRKIDNVESNIVQKLTNVLSEKLDGLDEVIVELIKAKTENESLRQRVNELNKENFSLKNELLSYRPVGLGLFIKKTTDEFKF